MKQYPRGLGKQKHVQVLNTLSEVQFVFILACVVFCTCKQK